MKAVIGLFLVAVIACQGVCDSIPRDYATYDVAGLIPFESIKKPTAMVKQAMSLHQDGKVGEAVELYWKAFKADNKDQQAIIGFAECAHKIGPAYVSNALRYLDYEEKYKLKQIPDHDWPLLLMRGLLKLGKDQAARKEAWKLLHLSGTYNNKDFVVPLVMYVFKDKRVTEYRTLFDRLSKKYPDVEGFDYYRALSYYDGNLGTYDFEIDTGKVIKAGGKEDHPRYDVAKKILNPYLNRNNPPLWAEYLVALVYRKLGEDFYAKKYAEKVLASNQKSRCVDVWKGNIRKLKLDR